MADDNSREFPLTLLFETPFRNDSNLMVVIEMLQVKLLPNVYGNIRLRDCQLPARTTSSKRRRIL